MASYRPFGMIRSGIWQSERFMSVASNDARLAYFWMHTSYKTCAGVLRIGPYHLLAEVDFVQDIARAEEIFNELEAAGLIVVLHPFEPPRFYRRPLSSSQATLSSMFMFA